MRVLSIAGAFAVAGIVTFFFSHLFRKESFFMISFSDISPTTTRCATEGEKLYLGLLPKGAYIARVEKQQAYIKFVR